MKFNRPMYYPCITMYNVIKYLFLLTTAVFHIVDCEITYGCYRQPTSPCSRHTLTCPDDGVIAVDDTSNNAYIAYRRKKPNYECQQNQMEICNATCCRRQGNNEDFPGFIAVNQSHRLSVYRNCSNQRTCTVTSPYSPDTDYDYIFYTYNCVPVNQVYNMMKISDVSFLYHGYLYYSGRTQTTSTTITKCCNITSPEPILVESVYIYLTEESSYNVKIYSENQTLLRCIDKGGIFIGYKELSISGDTIYHVVLDNLTLEEDDYIWIYIESNSNITVACGDSTASDSSIITTCDDISSSAYGDSTTSDSSIGTTRDDLTSSGTVPDSSDQLGIIIGCVVGIVVVVLVVVVVYCIIRRRRRNKSGDNHQELEYTNNKNNRGEYEYNTIQDGDTKKHESSYHTIDDRFLKNSTNDKKAAGGPSSNTSPRDGHYSTAKSPNVAIPTDTQPNATLPKDETDYQEIDKDFSTKPVGNLPNRTSPNQEPTYHVIDADFDVKPKTESGYCEPWETCIKLDPSSYLRTPALDSKFQYSVVKSKNGRRQGEGKPSEYDHISTKTTAVNMGKDEPVDTDYNHLKHTSFAPLVKDKTYYDHIPNRSENPLSDPYSDPTYNHLGDKSQTRIPQENTVSSNFTANRSADDPYNDTTYNHLGDKSPTRIPQHEKADSPNFTSNKQCQAERSADDPYNDPTYNHLAGTTDHTPARDPTYNRLGTNDHTPARDPSYNHFGTNGHTPARDPSYNHIGTNDHTPATNPTYNNHLGINGHTPARDPTYNHNGTNDHTPATNPTYNHIGTNDHTPATERRVSESNI